MMKFVFVSDFDGTLTHKDFYHIIIDKYLKEEGKKLYHMWKNADIKDIDFLNNIFQSINKSEAGILEDIFALPLDRYAKTFMNTVFELGGDFVVLSAGTSYYIERLFKHEGIDNVKIISNKGVYRDGGITLIPDPGSPFYSERYGIDKALVVKSLKNQYRKVYFAGDSEPDLGASVQADVVFATGSLVQLLRDDNRPFIPFENFKQVEEHLLKMEVLEG